jgi:hypothetical protein
MLWRDVLSERASPHRNGLGCDGLYFVEDQRHVAGQSFGVHATPLFEKLCPDSHPTAIQGHEQ